MIGQNKIREWVNKNINDFPHFIVLIGTSGCGKKTLAREIANKLSCVYTECSVSVDAVREVIDSSYQSQTKVLYCFADADNMRPQAKNAMLKITEEPPENAYFCLTIQDSGSLLDTIKSRAYVFNMQEYSPSEIVDYYKSDETHYDNYLELSDITTLCSTPYEVDVLCEYDKEFIEYVELVVDNIAEVEPANAFKSSNKLALKSDEGYDLKLFFKCFVKVCVDRINANDLDSVIKYADGVLATTKYANKCGRLGVNKQQLYDMWVLEIRQAWC